VHSPIRRLAIAACFLTLCAALDARQAAAQTPAPAAAPAPASAPAFGDIYNQAQTLLLKDGAPARAEKLLRAFVEAPGAALQPDQKARADALLKDIRDAMADQVIAEESARKRAEEGKAAREKDAADRQLAQQQKITRAEALRAEAAAGQTDKYRQSAQLFAEVAQERANDAFARAIDSFAQGDFDAARKRLELLKAWNDKQKADPSPIFAVKFDPEREARLMRYLARVDDAKANQTEGLRYADARRKFIQEQDAAARRQTEVAQIFDEGVQAHDRGSMPEAFTKFDLVRKSGVSLGPDKDAQLAAYIAKLTAWQNDQNERRAATVKLIDAGERLLERDDWRGADEMFTKALRDQSYLADADRTRLAELFKKVSKQRETALARGQQGMEAIDKEAEAARRAEMYLSEVKRQKNVLEEMEKSIAAEYLAVAKADVANLKYKQALVSVDEALRHQPGMTEAVELRAQIQAALGQPVEMAPLYQGRITKSFEAQLDMVRRQMDLSVNRGRTALQAKNYDEAVKEFDLAKGALDYLRPHYDVRSVESQLAGLMKDAHAGQERVAQETTRRQLWEVQQEAENAAVAASQRKENRKLALFAEANAEFSRGKYESAIKIARSIQEIDPDDVASRDLVEAAREQIKRRTWRDIYEQDRQAREDERLKLKEKLVWPSAIYQYPAKAIWNEICAREGAQYPTAKAAMRPGDLAIKTAFDLELRLAEVGGYGLKETCESLAKLMKDRYDRTIIFEFAEQRLFAGGDRPVPSQVLREYPYTFGQVLKKVLRSVRTDDITIPVGGTGGATTGGTTTGGTGTGGVTSANAQTVLQELSYFIRDEAVYIGTTYDCLQEEARTENCSLRQYDINDLLFVFQSQQGTFTIGGGGGTTGTTSGTTSSSSTSSTSGTSGTTSGAGNADLVVDFIYNYTGQLNWDAAPQVSSVTGSTSSSTSTTTGTTTTGTTSSTTSNAPSLLGPGRQMWLRQGYLMVHHVDRIHKKIEEILQELRSQTNIQVQVEARYITYTDNFLKQFGLNFSNFPNWSVGHMGPIPGFTINSLQLNPQPGITSNIFNMTGTFANGAQTRAILNAAMSSDHATVVSAPHLTVINTMEQSFTALLQSAYIPGYVVQNNAVVPQPLTQYPQSDVTLTVRPVVSADRRYVTMSVSPQISATQLLSQEAHIFFTPPGQSIARDFPYTQYVPLTDTNNIDSIIRVPDRGTAILGGLASLQDSDSMGTVPILSRIPILSRLVTHSQINKQRKHVLFMVTPTILLPNELEP
jgi:hypothetical protein